MNDVCPITDRQIDETVVRLVALLVFIIITIGYFKLLPWFSTALALDFFIRAFTKWPISYLAILAKFISKFFNLPTKPINAGPKIFAARLGFLFTLAISLFGFMQFNTTAAILAGALATCAALEAFFSICIGCSIYSILVKI
ncbi:MAG: DUF4395 domain-containing protein [Desulfobulbaceae bacterium]|nr:DUF4395 domain-containing protein [Desulfobulbaceae bacterium]